MTRIQADFRIRSGILVLVLCLLLGSGGELRAQSDAVVVTSATDSEIVVATLLPAAGGGFTLDGEPFAGGEVTLDSGATYLLALSDEGAWSATFQPVTMTVDLGISRLTVDIASAEDGTWWIGETAVDSGSIHSAGSNAAGRANRYELTLRDGEWAARYVAEMIAVEGTDLTATPNEDGSGYTIGTATVGVDGIGDITVDGAMYHLRRTEGGGVIGARFAAPLALRPDYTDVIGRGGRPRLSADDRTTDANEEGVALVALGVQFPVGELLGSGTSTVEGANIVAKARAEIVKLRGQVAQLVALRKDGAIDQTTLSGQLYNRGSDTVPASGKWVEAEAQIKTIFGDDHGDLEEVLNENRVVAAFDRLVAALSSVEAFTAATDADGPDYITGFQGRNATQAAAAFGRSASTATAVLSALGDTRYGAATFNETAKATDGLGTAETGQAFAYATIPAVQRASDVQVAGNAYYTGGTHAIDAEGNLYEGDIAVEVRFTSQQVAALVSGLADVETGAPWSHGFGGDVMNIHLPDASLNRVGSWNVWNGDARLSYERRAGGAPDEVLSGRAEFSGRLLGRGDAAGEQAVGVWSLDDGGSAAMLAGAFGAQRGPDRVRPSQKLLDDLEMVGASVTRDSMDPVGAEDDDITLALNPNNNNLKITFTSMGEDEVEVEYTLNRGTLLDGGYAPTTQDHAAQSARHEVRKDAHVKGVRETFGKTARQLASVVALDTADADSLRPTLHAQRQRLFDVLQGELRKLFGADIAGDNPGDAPVWTDPGVLPTSTTLSPAPAAWGSVHTDYPVSSSGVPQDGQLAGRIEDVQAALADVDAFVEAFGTGGVFDAYDNEGTQRPGFLGARALWDLPSGRLLLWTERTDFTRFGAWSRQTSADGAAALTAESQGVFAYSPLAQTATYASATERGYPGADLRNAQSGKVLARYEGRTTAVGGDVFYEGEVEALVEWDTTAVAGSLVFTIDSLVPTDPRFETMRHGPADIVDETTGEVRPRLGTRDVRSLEFRADIATDGDQLTFASTAEPEITVGGLVQQTPLAEGSYSNELVQVPYRGGGAIAWSEAQSFPVTFDTDAPVEMVAHADRLARYRGGGPDRMPLPITAIDGIDHRTNWLSNNEWHRFETAKGMLSIYNGDFADGSQIGRWGDARGGPWLPHPESNDRFDNRISKDYDDLEIPTYMVTNGDWRIHRYADGSIWVGRSNPTKTILGVQSRPLDPEVPNAAQTYGETNRPNDQWILTSAGASVMFKSWLERSGAVNFFTPPTGSALEGRFVGQDADGPTGMIGTWELPEGFFGVGDVREVIRGSFGAEYDPNP